jgi:RNA polymerase sigma-70 factor (ECF subfamily)
LTDVSRGFGADDEIMTSLALDRDYPEPHALLRTLYSDHGSALVAYATRILSDPQQAEDVVQETMLRAWRHADQLTPDRGSVPGWLTRVTRNIAVDKIRARNARPTEVDDDAAGPGVLQDHSAAVVDSVLLDRALAKLAPKHRQALHAVYFADRTTSEAALALGIPVGTVKTRVHHGLRRLRVQLREEMIAAGVRPR